MSVNLLLPDEKSFKKLLKIIKEKEFINRPQFYIESYCQTTPLFEIYSNLLVVEFDKLITIHSNITPKNILWATIVDSSVNQIDFKENYTQMINNIENINFESFVFYDVRHENYRLLFHYFKDKFSNDFSSIIIVIKVIPDGPMDILNFDISNKK